MQRGERAPMNNFLRFVLAFLWLLFLIWTIRRLHRIANNDEIVLRIGVARFGLTGWLGTTLWTAYLAAEVNPVHPLWFYGAVLGFYLLPVCLWGGYLWGRIMAHLFQRRD